MPLFKRAASKPAATGDFWEWWAGGRDRVANAIATGGFDEGLIGEISSAVASIHPAMAWELEPGRAAQHAFCISPEGNAELRQVALRWLASAPEPDATWEYHASKQASPKLMGLEIGSSHFDLEEVRAIASWDSSRRRVDVKLWHPQFGAVPENVRIQVGFIFLDSLLGEDDVERWVGQIDLLEAPTGGRTPAELKAEIERRASEPSGDATWVLGELRDPSGSVAIVSADAGLKRIDHPFADHHVTLAVVFGADRMPTGSEAALLNEQEDDFLSRVGRSRDVCRPGDGAGRANDALRCRGPGCAAPGHRWLGRRLARLAQRRAPPDAAQGQLRAGHGLVVPARPGSSMT